MGGLPELENGWNVNYSSVTEIVGDVNVKSQKELEAILCRADIREFGQPVLVNLLKTDTHLPMPVVLQVNSWRNVSAPKSSFSSAKDDLTHGGLVRFFLTDGHSSVSALATENLSRVGLSMGTKIRVHKDCPMEAGFLMLGTDFMTVIGGSVERLRIKNEKERTEIYRLNGSAAARSKLRQPHTEDDIPLSQSVTVAANKPSEEEQAVFDETRQKNIAVASEGRVKTNFATPNIQAPPKLDVPREERPYKEKPSSNRGHDRQAKRRGRRGSDEEVPAEFARPSGPSTLFDFIAPGAAAIMNQNDSSTQRTAATVGGPNNYRQYSEPQQKTFDHARSVSQRSNMKGQGDDRFGRNNRFERKGADAVNRSGGGRSERGNQEPRRDRKVTTDRNDGKGTFRPGEKNAAPGRDRTRPKTEPSQRNSNYNNSQRLTFYSNGRRDHGNQANTQKQKDPQFFEDDFPSIDPLSQELHGMNLGPSSSKNITTRTSIVHGTPRWRVNEKCLALWEDGEFYLATILALGPGNQCTVRYDEYGNTNTLEQAMLLTI